MNINIGTFTFVIGTLNSLLMLRFWWNFIFRCKIGRENRFCQYFCTYFSIFRENYDFFLFGHVHSIWVWNHNFWAKTNPNSVLISWKYFQQNNGFGFFKFIFDFLLWLKMYLNIEKPWFSEIYPIFQYIIESTQKTRTKIKNQEPLFYSHGFSDCNTSFVFVLE